MGQQETYKTIYKYYQHDIAGFSLNGLTGGAIIDR